MPSWAAQASPPGGSAPHPRGEREPDGDTGFQGGLTFAVALSRSKDGVALLAYVRPFDATYAFSLSGISVMLCRASAGCRKRGLSATHVPTTNGVRRWEEQAFRPPRQAAWLQR
jgi:hypothetical protein